MNFFKRLFQRHDNKCSKAQCKEDRSMRDGLSERQIDKTIQDSYPASDPPSWY